MKLYSLKLLFEWGGDCLWCDNTAARKKFGVGPIEAKLDLSDKIIERLHQLTELHDNALDWNDPAGPSPWNSAQFIKFDEYAREVLQDIQSELGSTCMVRYDPLGGDEFR